MKCIIAGSRGVTEMFWLTRALHLSGFEEQIECVVSGGAPGPDELGIAWARANEINKEIHLAQWRDRDGAFYRNAGMIRNATMAKICEPGKDALLAVWDGISPGTAHMIKVATKRGLNVFVLNQLEQPSPIAVRLEEACRMYAKRHRDLHEPRFTRTPWPVRYPRLLADLCDALEELWAAEDAYDEEI